MHHEKDLKICKSTFTFWANFQIQRGFISHLFLGNFASLPFYKINILSLAGIYLGVV